MISLTDKKIKCGRVQVIERGIDLDRRSTFLALHDVGFRTERWDGTSRLEQTQSGTLGYAQAASLLMERKKEVGGGVRLRLPRHF